MVLAVSVVLAAVVLVLVVVLSAGVLAEGVKWAGEGCHNPPPCRDLALVGDGRRSGRHGPSRQAASI